MNSPRQFSQHVAPIPDLINADIPLSAERRACRICDWLSAQVTLVLAASINTKDIVAKIARNIIAKTEINPLLSWFRRAC